MTNAKSYMYSLFSGLAGGLAAWAGVEIVLWRISDFPDMRILSIVLGAAAGFLLGLILPTAEGLRQDQPRKVLSNIIIGSLAGGIFGALGMMLGQLVLGLIVDALALSGAPLAATGAAAARIPGWMILGAAVGSVSGIRTLSPGRILRGALGGLLGGFLGGIVAEAMTILTGRFIGRGLGMLFWGAAVALISDWQDRRRAKGRLTVLNGPLKGRSFPVNQRNITIAAEPGADLALPNGQSGENHAVVKVRRGTVILEGKDESVVELNGETVKSNDLRYDDVIKIGNATMIYEAKK